VASKADLPQAETEISPPAEKWRFDEGDEIAAGRLAVSLLGGGERYETYLASDERLLSLVVLKVVRPHLVDDPHSLRGLAAEAELLERLRHPVIVRGFGAALDGPRPYLALEHLEGPRLSTLIRKYGRLELEQLLPLGLQLASAAHYLAGERIVHLDVKPSNIIMSAPARLIDLSIARPLERLAHRANRIGTDAYMAPEQCEPERLGPITSAADVWGIGATLYHAASGRQPFPATPDDRFPQLRGSPEPLPHDLPAPFTELIAECLDPDADARPAAAEIVARLEPLVGGLPKRPVLGRFRVRARRWAAEG
jgi:eukaryotic-like serine/threonine-protein kinase